MDRTTPEFLSGWKEIAAYLGKGVRTVQRYERHMGLPVRRPARKARGSVLAARAELDKWMSAQPLREAFQVERTLPNASRAASAALKESVANMRRLREEMLELREELRASVEKLHSTFRSVGRVRSEELHYLAKQTGTVRTHGLQPPVDAKTGEFESAPSRIGGD